MINPRIAAECNHMCTVQGCRNTVSHYPVPYRQDRKNRLLYKNWVIKVQMDHELRAKFSHCAVQFLLSFGVSAATLECRRGCQLNVARKLIPHCPSKYPKRAGHEANLYATSAIGEAGEA